MSGRLLTVDMEERSARTSRLNCISSQPVGVVGETTVVIMNRRHRYGQQPTDRSQASSVCVGWARATTDGMRTQGSNETSSTDALAEAWETKVNA